MLDETLESSSFWTRHLPGHLKQPQVSLDISKLSVTTWIATIQTVEYALLLKILI